MDPLRGAGGDALAPGGLEARSCNPGDLGSRTEPVDPGDLDGGEAWRTAWLRRLL